MGTARTRTARWTRRVVVLAILGLLVQVAIVVWRVRHKRLPPIVGGFATVTVGDRTRQVLVKRTWAATDCYSESCRRTQMSLVREVDWFDFNRLMVRAAGAAEAPAWYRPWTEDKALAFIDAADPTRGMGGAMSTMARAGLGWPFRAFEGVRAWDSMVDARGMVSYWTPSGAFASRGYIRIGQTDYPVSPIWSGLALDVGLFTAIGVLTFAALDTWRWVRRVREGQCPACRYDLTGLAPGQPCPECGAASA